MKPKYSFFKNFKYAREGFYSAIKKETSFRLQFLNFIIFTIIAILTPYPLWIKLILIGSLFIPIIVELLNSAIEAVVDMVTEEYHELAKYAKDVAAASVMISFLIPIFIWVSIILYHL